MAETLSAVQRDVLDRLSGTKWASAYELSTGLHTLRALERNGLVEREEDARAYLSPRVLIRWRRTKRKEA